MQNKYIKNKVKISPNYIDGRTLIEHYCLCGNKISYNTWSYGTGRCLSCAHKGINNPAFIDGKTLKKHYCIDCKVNKISYNNFYYGNQRCRSCSKKGKLSARFGRLPTHGKHIKYKRILFRSSYEVKYAKYLDKNNIKWLYESQTFDLGNTTYTPDFYLPKTDEYIEIKGWWRDKSKQKFELFKKLYNNINIKVYMKSKLVKLGILED